MTVRVSLIMPTRNRGDVLRLSLPRLLDQTVPRDAYEIVVVDDASEDDTGAVVKDFGAANMLYARQEKRTAAAGARNRAISMATGPLLLFVDDDALVRSDFVSEHLSTHERHPGSVVAGPIVEVTEPPAQANPPVGRFLGWHSNPFPTGNASVARQAILDAGGFDEGFNAYGWEDPEMYRRLIGTGVKRRYNWRAPIWHYKPAAHRRDFFDRLKLEESRGAMGAYYYAKHPTFSVGFETKQLGVFKALDRVAEGLFGLDARIAEARASGVEPASGFLKLLMVNHTEIQAGLRKRAELERARRG